MDSFAGAPNGFLEAAAGAGAGAGATGAAIGGAAGGATGGTAGTTGAGAVPEAPWRTKGFEGANTAAGAEVGTGAAAAGFPNGFPANNGDVLAAGAREAIGANEFRSTRSYFSASAAQML